MGVDKLQPVRPHIDRPSASDHNMIVSFLQNMVRSSGANAFVDANGQIVFRSPPRKTGASVQQFRFKSLEDDHLIARTWDGTTEGTTDVVIARPYHLRRSVFDGRAIGGWLYTYTSATARTLTQTGEQDQEEEVYPVYAEDDLLYAVQTLGGTGLTVTIDEAEVAPLWVDLNTDGRGWRRTNWLPAGTGQYKVLQLDADDEPHWDYVRAHS